MYDEKRKNGFQRRDPKITDGSQKLNEPLRRNKVEMQIEKMKVWDSEVGYPR